MVSWNSQFSGRKKHIKTMADNVPQPSTTIKKKRNE
jgi:hypothetical protein